MTDPATSEKIARLQSRFADAQAALGGGCSDGYCVIKKPQGMHTNGGCRCLYYSDHTKLQRVGQMLRIAHELSAAIKEVMKDD